MVARSKDLWIPVPLLVSGLLTMSINNFFSLIPYRDYESENVLMVITSPGARDVETKIRSWRVPLWLTSALWGRASDSR